MNRRDFLLTVLGSTAAAVVLPQLDVLAATLPESAETTLDGPLWAASFKAIHQVAWEEFQRQMAHGGLPVLSSRVSSDVQKVGQVYTNQLNVAMRSMIGRNDAQQSYVVPAMTALAAGALDRGLDRWAALPMPFAGVDYAASIGALRMMSFYDPGEGEQLVRFDVLGGCSDPLFALRRRGRFTKQMLESRKRQREAGVPMSRQAL